MKACRRAHLSFGTTPEQALLLQKTNPASTQDDTLEHRLKNYTYKYRGTQEGRTYFRSMIFLNSILARTPRDWAWMRVMIRDRRSSLISSSSPRRPALKNTWVGKQ